MVIISLNSNEEFIFVMVKCGVLFEVRNASLDYHSDELRLQRGKDCLPRQFSLYKTTTISMNKDEISNDNDVRVVNSATSKKFVVKSTMFLIEAFINTPGPLLTERRTNTLITC
jgi:hypothetical protein